ncbi:MAG: hypothetical protein ACRCZS_13220 [Chroococcidiopsis sp.]
MIEHPDLSKFAVIRTDYVAMLGSRPAAMLLSVVEAWTNWLKERRKSILVRLSGNALSDAVGGLFARKTFMKAGKLLEELGLIARVQKSSSDRTYQYLLQTQAVQNRLNLLVWWNTAAKYIQLVTGAITSNWLKNNLERLEALLKANVPFGTFQCPIETPLNVPYNPTLKDLSNDTKNTTTDMPAVQEKKEIPLSEITDSQINECCTQISVVSKDVQLNLQVRNAIAQYWVNFPAALQHLKKAISERWKVNNLTGVFIKALKEGVPPEDVQPITTGWAEWANKALARKLMLYSTSEGADIRVHLTNGRSRLWSEIKSLPMEDLVHVCA